MSLYEFTDEAGELRRCGTIPETPEIPVGAAVEEQAGFQVWTLLAHFGDELGGIGLVIGATEKRHLWTPVGAILRPRPTPALAPG